MDKTKRIVLCADDYGQALTISEGILDLVSRQRLTAVSCMANSPRWPEDAAKLLVHKENIDIGLHFNLTHGKPMSAAMQKHFPDYFPSLPILLRKAYLFDLDQTAVADELRAQIQCFVEAAGFLPQFLDGHQHVHHLPVIRKAVIDVYNEQLRAAQTYVRLVAMHLKPTDLFNKKIVIYATGVRRFRQLLAVHQIPHNRAFSGIYKFAASADIAKLFPTFLDELDNGGLIMCHPGLASDGTPDEIATARVDEYQYFASPEFEKALRDRQVVLSRFQR